MVKSIADFEYEIETLGLSVFPGVVPAELLARLRLDIPKREKACRLARLANGLDAGMEGVAHHVVGGDDSLSAFLNALYLREYIGAYFGGPYILNSYGAFNNIPSTTYSHGQNFHRDVRTYSGSFRLMLNMLVMVDDFTVENGATRFVAGTHRRPDRPSDDFLDSHAVHATGSAGTIILFDSNLWHSAAPNRTQGQRMVLTLTFTRPFFKQQMDYPRLLGEDYPPNEEVRQLLGYNARVPASYDEWYQPPERRMYKPGQG